MPSPLQPSPPTSGSWITAYGPGTLEVNGQTHTTALLVAPDQAPAPWPFSRPQDITAEALAGLRQHQPEVVLIGTGAQQLFLNPAVLKALMTSNDTPPIGVEMMTTPSACRTFGVLASEGRRVLAVLYPLPGQSLE